MFAMLRWPARSDDCRGQSACRGGLRDGSRALRLCHSAFPSDGQAFFLAGPNAYLAGTNACSADRLVVAPPERALLPPRQSSTISSEAFLATTMKGLLATS